MTEKEKTFLRDADFIESIKSMPTIKLSVPMPPVKPPKDDSTKRSDK